MLRPACPSHTAVGAHWMQREEGPEDRLPRKWHQDHPGEAAPVIDRKTCKGLKIKQLPTQAGNRPS